MPADSPAASNTLFPLAVGAGVGWVPQIRVDAAHGALRESSSRVPPYLMEAVPVASVAALRPRLVFVGRDRAMAHWAHVARHGWWASLALSAGCLPRHVRQERRRSLHVPRDRLEDGRREGLVCYGSTHEMPRLLRRLTGALRLHAGGEA